MRLGERLREVRLAAGIGVHDMARRLGVSTWQVQLVETGRTCDPSLGYVWRCADISGMPIADLLMGVECPRPRPRRRPVGEPHPVGPNDGV